MTFNVARKSISLGTVGRETCAKATNFPQKLSYDLDANVESEA